jgi:uncharacterized protein (TIGR03492 family)
MRQETLMAERIGVLFVSNGYGEDNVAAHIARELRERFPGTTVSGFPTVGGGRFYSECGIPLAGEGIRMPSEGFVRSTRDLLNDVRRGLICATVRMGKRVRAASRQNEFIVITGDPYLLLYTSLFAKADRHRKIFIGTLQSEWYGSRKPFKEHYSLLERWWLRLFCRLVIVRDDKTARYLRSRGIQYAVSFGNPMMECFDSYKAWVFSGDRTVIGILPGSKSEAYENFGKIIETVEALVGLSPKEKNYLFAVAVSPNLDIGELADMHGLTESGRYERDPAFTVFRIKRSGIELFISSERFGRVIGEAALVIGLSGTGNEQAAGLGKPVVGFWGFGSQITKKFMVAQKRLLGDSLILLPPDPTLVATRIIEVLEDGDLRKRIGDNGKLRMGGRGSVASIATEIGVYLDREWKRFSDRNNRKA